MIPKIAERVDELQLLGWSEEGAQEYAKNFSYSEQFFSLTNDQIINYFIIFFAIFMTILTYLYIRKVYSNKDVNNNSVKKEFDENLNIENIISNDRLTNSNSSKGQNILEKSNKTLKEVYNFDYKRLFELFQITSIKTDKIMEHLLLILLLSFELFVKLLMILPSLPQPKKSKNYLETKKLINKNNEIFQGNNNKERRIELLKLTNKELKIILRDIPNISRLNKIQLIERVLKSENS